MLIALEVIGVGAAERVVRAITTDLAGAEKSPTLIQTLQSLQRSFDWSMRLASANRLASLRMTTPGSGASACDFSRYPLACLFRP